MNPDPIYLGVRFVLGLAVGSFMNVVSMRYDPDRPLWSGHILGGRSYCPHCKRTLRWFELVPLFSYAFLGGRCRTCRKGLSLQYPLVELATGLLFACMPFVIKASGQVFAPQYSGWISAVWTAAAVLLLLMSLIDRRTQIIPDEINVLLIALGAVRIFLESSAGAPNSAFLSRFALLFSFTGNPWVNHLAAALGAGLFFGLLVLATRGKGMGLGDVKLAFALGFLFGAPDTIFLIMFGFIIGALYGVWKIVWGRGRLKTAVPFGPFLALGALAVMLWGNGILSWYFGLFGIV